jgi:hypothetical protein
VCHVQYLSVCDGVNLSFPMIHRATHVIKHHIAATMTAVQTAHQLVTATGVHKPIIHGFRMAGTVLRHPITQAAAKGGVRAIALTSKGIFKGVTHPAVAQMTSKAWFQGGRVAKHSAKFMMKAATWGFRIGK